jgi:hypothetical protein
MFGLILQLNLYFFSYLEICLRRQSGDTLASTLVTDVCHPHSGILRQRGPAVPLQAVRCGGWDSLPADPELFGAQEGSVCLQS